MSNEIVDDGHCSTIACTVTAHPRRAPRGTHRTLGSIEHQRKLMANIIRCPEDSIGETKKIGRRSPRLRRVNSGG
ncbi:MAG: hypothetical protein ABR969_06190 [Sedimentisphaerales bacterium]